MGYMSRVDWADFPYDANVGDECLSHTLGDSDSDVKSIVKTFRKNNTDKIILAHLKINFIRNKFDQLSDMFKGHTDHCVKSVHIWKYSVSAFSRSISPYSLRMRGNADQNNSECEPLLRSGCSNDIRI